MIGYLTPYIPMVGLISSGITIGAHVADKKLNSKEEPGKRHKKIRNVITLRIIL